MNVKKLTKKISAVLLSAALLCTPLSAFAEQEGAAPTTKEDSAFIILNADGTVQKQIVTSWLHNDSGLSGVVDQSSLEGIHNVKGSVEPSQSGEQVTWNTAESDVYYQGTTSKEPPVQAEIAYRLNGKEVAPAELAGQSGKVEITVHLKVKGEKQMVAGASRTIAPLYLTGVMVSLPNETFQNVSAENGFLLNDAATQFAAFATIPGLKESFSGVVDARLTEIEEKLSDTFTITAEAKDFALPSIMLVAVSDPALLKEIDVKGLASLTNGVEELKGATGTIHEGTSQLKGAVTTLSSKMSQFSKQYQTFAAGLAKAKSGADALLRGAGELKAGTALLAEKTSGLTELLTPEFFSSLQDLSDIIASLQLDDATKAALAATGTNVSGDVSAMAGGIIGDLTGTTLTPSQQKEVAAIVQKRANEAGLAISGHLAPAQAVLTSLGDTQAKVEKVLAKVGGVEGLKKLLQTVQSSTSELGKVLELDAGAKKLLSGADDLANGICSLNSASKEVEAAISQFEAASKQLAAATGTLDAGVAKFEEEGISKLYATVKGLVDDLDTVKAIGDAVFDASEADRSYAGAPEGAQASVKLIMRTEEIKKPEVKEEAPQKTETKTTFWERVTHLFS